MVNTTLTFLYLYFTNIYILGTNSLLDKVSPPHGDVPFASSLRFVRPRIYHYVSKIENYDRI